MPWLIIYFTISFFKFSVHLEPVSTQGVLNIHTWLLYWMAQVPSLSLLSGFWDDLPVVWSFL
jgi:hypothetical protein